MTKKIVKYLDKHRNKIIKTYNFIKNYCEKFFLFCKIKEADIWNIFCQKCHPLCPKIEAT